MKQSPLTRAIQENENDLDEMEKQTGRIGTRVIGVTIPRGLQRIVKTTLLFSLPPGVWT